MKVSIIAAVARNGVIGNNGELPWHLPSDLRYFKGITEGHPVIMGRKTFESILSKLGRPLPGRTNIVLSRRNILREVKTHELWFLAFSLPEALKFASMEPGADEVFVIGGAEVFAEAMLIADKMYLTELGEEVEGDATFPIFKPQEWSKRLSARVKELSRGDMRTLNFVVYTRIRA